MNPAIQKTISIFVLILIGFLLKSKIKGKDQMKGIKILILSIALPATIFVALLKIEFDLTLVYLPLVALALNGILFLITRVSLPLFGIKRDGPEGKTITLLFPSLAPGLSCFPFLIEYTPDDALAFAALADVGNKIFVLVILYLIAMRWYFSTQNMSKQSTGGKVKSLVISLCKEPVNLAIIVALTMLYFGWNLKSLPLFLQDPITKMSLLMTPMVLLFIGMAVKVNWRQIKTIGSLLIYRSACAFLLSGLLLYLLPSSISFAMLIVIVAFPQSAVSFWPYAHISLVNDLEVEKDKKTFSPELALNFLAISLPLSSVIILSICIFPSFFINATNLLGFGSLFLLIFILPRLMNLFRISAPRITNSTNHLKKMQKEVGSR